MPYGLPWRRRRKELHQFFHPVAVSQYQPLQQREALMFLKKLLEKPENFLHHVRQCVPSFDASPAASVFPRTCQLKHCLGRI